jgi:hypothetical protein
MSANPSGLNRVVLILNCLVLLTTFMVSLKSTDVQVALASATSRAPSGRLALHPPPATEFVRLVGSLEGVLPPTALDQLGPEQLRAVQDALIAYRRFISAGVDRVLYSPDPGAPPRQQLALLSKDVRFEIEQRLRTAIRDDAMVQQLATAVIRFG